MNSTSFLELARSYVIACVVEQRHCLLRYEYCTLKYTFTEITFILVRGNDFRKRVYHFLTRV